MYCLSQSYNYLLENLNSEHKILIAHGLRLKRQFGGNGAPHAFNIDVCCDLAIDVTDANEGIHKDAGNIVMPLDEYMKLMQMEYSFGKFKTYTLKEYNKKGYADYETNGKGIHQFWDLSG
tara:strand:- start:78 stop:437 length:360 start_codon:yes stop_codon:yes gene_type:complete